jgi:hypothetical protein
MPGPVITRYEIEPATGVKGSQVVNLAKDLARSLSLVSIRVVETIPGKNYMALELPNAKRQTIRLSEILGSQVYNEAKSLLTMGLGKDIVGNPVVADLAKMPHVLVAGTTGSGKSVGINAMILSLLYKAEAKRCAPADDRPQDAGNVGLRRHSAPAAPGGHRHEAGRARPELVRGRDGAPLQAAEQAGRAQPGGLQQEDRRGQGARASSSPTPSASRPSSPSRWTACRTSWSSSTSWPT